jgi:hypothetical protein
MCVRIGQVKNKEFIYYGASELRACQRTQVEVVFIVLIKVHFMERLTSGSYKFDLLLQVWTRHLSCARHKQ